MKKAVGGQPTGNNFYFSDMNGSSAIKCLASDANEDKYHEEMPWLDKNVQAANTFTPQYNMNLYFFRTCLLKQITLWFNCIPTIQ